MNYYSESEVAEIDDAGQVQDYAELCARVAALEAEKDAANARADAAEKERDEYAKTMAQEIAHWYRKLESAEAEAGRLRKITRQAFDSLKEWDDEYNEDSATPSPIQYAIDRLAAALLPVKKEGDVQSNTSTNEP